MGACMGEGIGMMNRGRIVCDEWGVMKWVWKGRERNDGRKWVCKLGIGERWHAWGKSRSLSGNGKGQEGGIMVKVDRQGHTLVRRNCFNGYVNNGIAWRAWRGEYESSEYADAKKVSRDGDCHVYETKRTCLHEYRHVEGITGQQWNPASISAHNALKKGFRCTDSKIWVGLTTDHMEDRES